MFVLIFIWSWIYNILSTDSFILQDTYNVMLKDSVDYKVDLIINPDDYEMIDKKQLKDFNIDDDKKKFNDLDIMAMVENYKALSIKSKNVNPPYDAMPPVEVSESDNKIKTVFKKQMTTHVMVNTQYTTDESDTQYDYNNLVNEYDEEANNESRSNNAYHLSKSATESSEYGAIDSLRTLFLLKSESPNCTDVKGIGIVALKCLIEDYNSQRQSTKDIAARLWRIFQIWFLVYLAVAVPLWCTRGWCCCCLFCKFFKPRRTIEEAKKYVLLYPPGVFRTKNGDIRYEPSEREKECYEEFEHFIKTL